MSDANCQNVRKKGLAHPLFERRKQKTITQPTLRTGSEPFERPEKGAGPEPGRERNVKKSDKMKNGKIGVTTENIFPVIKKFLYSDHEIFLRELISNAVDATQKLKTLSSIGEVKGELGDVSVRVTVDPAKKTLTVTDRGIGMTAEEVDKYINQIAFSGAEEFMAKYQNQAIIGHFGLGFYSSFMVADKVEIYTQSYLSLIHI